MTQRDAEILAAWAARLEASNPQPAPERPATPYTCARCGGTFKVLDGRQPPKQCPICACSTWGDGARKYRLKRAKDSP